MRRLVVGLLGLSVSVRCANVGVTRVNGAPGKAVGCKLDIYTSEAEVKRPFQVLCLIDSRTGTTAFDTKTAAAAIENAKPTACGCGADALIVTAADTEGATYARWGQGKAVLKAIRYQGSPPPESVPAAVTSGAGRNGNATIRISLDKGAWQTVDADLEGRTVRALYSQEGRRLPLYDCVLQGDLKATCVQTVDRATFSVEIDAGTQSSKP